MAGIRVVIDPGDVVARYRAVRARLAAAGGADVRLVAVTKGFGPEAVRAAAQAGIADVGESYAQECLAKLEWLDEVPTLHFVGGLQRNKVRKLAPVVDVWQSVDRLDLGLEIAKRAPGATVMVQVDLSGEESKRGCPPGEAPDLVARLTDAGLEVVGLMGIGPMAEPEAARPGFALLRGLVDELGLSECSMGMSADLEVAVQEGTTMVRVGTDIFGPRPETGHWRSPGGMPESGSSPTVDSGGGQEP